MAVLTPIKKDADIREDWRKVNALVSSLNAALSEIRRLSGAVEELRVKLQHTSGRKGTGIYFKGIYSTGESYVAGDLVSIPFGAHAATYLCTEDVSYSELKYPWNGVKWAMAGKLVDQGTWA
jgi:hypothetical protein